MTEAATAIAKNISSRSSGFALLASHLVDKTAGKARAWYLVARRIVGELGARKACMLLACAVCVSAMLYGSAGHAQEPMQTQRFDIDIPSMNAADALNRLAEQTSATFLFPYDLARVREANAVTGRYTISEALEKLLQGSGLSGGLSDKGTITISVQGDRETGTEGAKTMGKAKGGKNATAEATTSSRNRGVLGAIGAAVLSIFTAQGATGQEAQRDQPENKQAIEEIIVTAQKREERLLDVPQSVTVLSADYLDKINALQFRDFANTVPGLSYFRAGVGQTIVSLRGVTAGRDVAPTVGIYVDEVPYGGSTSFSQAATFALDVGLFDLDRIEVLRGPQGTLWGASTLGGLLKYVTKRPDATRFGVDAQTGVSGTEHGGISYNGAATINAPIATDKAALRATGYYSRDGGYIDNLGLDKEDANRSEIYGGRVDLLFTPTEALGIRITGFLQDIDGNGQENADFTLAGVPVDGSLDQRRLFPETFDQRFRLISGTVTYDLDWASLTSVSSYQTVRSKNVFDQSQLVSLCGLVGRSCSALAGPNKIATDKFVQELRLTSEGSRPFEWLIGGFYTHEDSEHFAELIQIDLAGQVLPSDLFTFLVPSVYEEYAAFGDLTWHLSEKLNVTGGIRYAHNSQKFEQIGGGLFGSSTPARRSSDEVVTYLANARYHFSDHATAYFRYATGYRPGGPNFAGTDPFTGLPLGPETFGPDRLKSYEVGFKAETANRRFGLDVAGYYIDWNNIQITVFRGAFGGIGNAPGGAEVLGAELTLTAHPIPAFTVTGAFSYQDPEMSEADPDLRAAKGERLPNVPNWIAALNADYELPWWESLQPTVGATLRYVGDKMASFDNSSFHQARIPDYTMVDLRAGLTLDRVNVQLYVRNLFDERGQQSALNFRGLHQPSIVQPRAIGVSLSTSF